MRIQIKQESGWGYHGTATQPGIVLAVTLSDPPPIDAAVVDDWLKRCFRVEVPPLGDAARGAAEPFLWRVMQLANALGRWVRLPLFDPGAMLCLTEDATSATCSARVAMPWPEEQPVAVLGDALNTAARIVAWRPGTLPTPDDMDAVSDQLEARFQKPAQQRIRGGASTMPLLRVAHSLGLPFHHLAAGAYQLGWGSASLLTLRSSVDGDGSPGATLTQDKHHTARVLRAAGLPAPSHALVADATQAKAAAGKLGYPVVIKPADRDRGEGITTGVAGPGAVPAAFAIAAACSRRILVEQQVPGLCFRILVVRGAVVYCVGRKPMGVTGDGEHTIPELIATARAAQALLLRGMRLKPFASDEQARTSAANAGFAWESVPAAGAFVPLRPRESIEWGGLPDVATERLHADNAAAAIAAAELLRLDVCGVDLITEDVGVPWYENGAIINELNYAPNLSDFYDFQREGTRSLLSRLVPGNGRIPVVAFVGGSALRAACAWQQAQCAGEKAAFIATGSGIEGPAGPLPSTAAGLLAECHALLLNRTVDALAVVIDAVDALAGGAPVDRFSELVIVDRALRRSARHPARADTAEVNALVADLVARAEGNLLEGEQASTARPNSR